MARINPSTNELQCKIVYYGPAYAGKTTNLQSVHQHLPVHCREELLVNSTRTERTLFFACRPPKYSTINGIPVTFYVYTLQGNVLSDQSRPALLTGADGIVFVATSDPVHALQNTLLFRELLDTLARNTRHDTPIVLQINKRDMPNAIALETINRSINHHRYPFFEAIARIGVGVMETFNHTCLLVSTKIAYDQHAS